MLKEQFLHTYKFSNHNNIKKQILLKELIKNNKLILKTQQRLKSESHNAFTKDINKIALSSHYDKKKCNQLIQQKHMNME